ncbi:hypothetical protein Tcan_03655 [Toxocara canis]|uniref:Uncharacterized protein n=1 Tax=Toxocara canis TaxID=6265 RepID=A0A0B2V9J7_TOXCA|nr:hypothetical protein Tcan_03655 [Toxocara canis]
MARDLSFSHQHDSSLPYDHEYSSHDYLRVRETIGSVLRNYYQTPVVYPAYMSIHVEFADGSCSSGNRCETSAHINSQISMIKSRKNQKNDGKTAIGVKQSS